MFAALGRLVAHHSRLIVGIWVVLIAVGYLSATTGFGGQTLFQRLQTGEPSISGSESSIGSQLLQENSSTGEEITLIVDGVSPTAADPAVLKTARLELSQIAGVQPPVLDPQVLAETAPDAAKSLIAASGNGFLVVVALAPGLDETAAATSVNKVADRLERLGSELTKPVAEATFHVGSATLIGQEFTHQSEKDLTTGELIALPIALLVMVLVFGGFVAAAMPLAGALASIGAGLGIMLLLTRWLDVHISVINVVTLLGLGLSIDYGLLIVSRFREELHKVVSAELTTTGALHALDPETGQPVAAGRRSKRGGAHDAGVRDALITTMSTAGRTVAFSALTVAIAISGLLVFNASLLRSVGTASVTIVIVALATALTLVPALLRLTGRKIIADGPITRISLFKRLFSKTADVTSNEGAFSKLAGQVQRRPWWVFISCIVVLGGLAIPAFSMTLRNSGIEMLPASSSQRQFITTLTDQYPSTVAPEIQVIAQATPQDAAALVESIRALPGVDFVGEPAALGAYSVIAVDVTGTDGGSKLATDTVTKIRALDPGIPTWTTGQAAGQVDFLQAINDRAGWAIGIVILASFVLLFLMTGSLIIPLKALLTNVLSLGATLGILTWGFQQGHLEGLLGFTSPGGLEILVVVMVLAFGFGLAMDYEVFLLARIKELHDAGADNDTAVRIGLQQSGRIITSAAAIIVVVFAGFIFGELLVIKEVGFALAVAVLLDATIVRMLLVPATMTLLGSLNWWAPAPLRKIHKRLAITH